MNIIDDIITALSSVGLFVVTGVYKGTPQPDGSVVKETNYIVLTPLTESNPDIADDVPLTEMHDADVNLYYVGNYQTTKNNIVSLLRTAGFYIADRQYIEYIPETKQHHFVITVEKKEVL